MTGQFPYDLSVEELRVRVRQSAKNPSVRQIHEVVLKPGPQTYRFATLFEIVDRETGTLHHYALKIETWNRTRKHGWIEKADKSVTLESTNRDEIQLLVDFITTVRGGHLPGQTGDYQVFRDAELKHLQELLTLARSADVPDKVRVLRAAFEHLDVAKLGVHDWKTVFGTGTRDLVREVAAASRLVEYRDFYDELKTLVADPTTSEGALQALLSVNPWMFGSEYSELVDRRTWTRDDRLDFMLRRTVDGYLEIIEIKTPMREAILRHDASHDSFGPSAKLSAVIGQVIRYIDETERNRDSIIAHDGFDPLKIRAKIIIGRDGPAAHQAALRNLNGHLHRVEVLTFDQLIRTAGLVLALFEEIIDRDALGQDDGDDLPF